ncbi:unnamed protein product, partial [Lymnaea stagnalis]
SAVHGAWVKGSSAGGNGDAPDLFWTNPQYHFTVRGSDDEVAKQTTLIASLIQKNRNNRIKIEIGVRIYQSSRPVIGQFNSTSAASLKLVDDSSLHHRREVSKRFQLSPGHYVIIPYTGKSDQESEFILRLYSEHPAEISQATF